MVNKHRLKGITKLKQYNGDTHNIIQFKGVVKYLNRREINNSIISNLKE